MFDRSPPETEGLFFHDFWIEPSSFARSNIGVGLVCHFAFLTKLSVSDPALVDGLNTCHGGMTVKQVCNLLQLT